MSGSILDGSIIANEHFSYFNSKFHCFDAAIIVAGFIVDVCKYISERAFPLQHKLLIYFPTSMFAAKRGC